MLSKFLIWVKKKIIKNRFGRKIDSRIRVALNHILSKARTTRANHQTSSSQYVFFLYGGLGDILVDARILSAFQKEKKLKILVLCPREHNAILKKIGYDFDVEVYDKNCLISDALRLRKCVKGYNFFLHQVSTEVLFLTLLLGVKITRGFHKNYRWYIHPDGRIRRIQSPSTQRFDRFKMIMEETFGPLAVAPPIRLLKKENLSLLLTKAGPATAAGVHSIDLWESVVIGCVDANVRKLSIIGDKSGTETAKNICRLVAKNHPDLIVSNYVGKTTLSKTIDLCSRSDLCIGLDSGLAHLANSLNIPTLRIFLFSNPKDFTWGKFSDVFFYKQFNCMPCVSESLDGIDNYAPICSYQFQCSRHINRTHLRKTVSEFINKDEYFIN